MKDRTSIAITTVANGYIVEPPPRYVADAPVDLRETLVFEQLDHLVQWMRVHLRKPEQSVDAVKQEQPEAGPLNVESKPLAIGNFLARLPKDIREAAVRNTKPERLFTLPPEQTFGSALAQAFAWQESPEGHAFWNAVHDAACDFMPFPTLPASTKGGAS